MKKYYNLLLLMLLVIIPINVFSQMKNSDEIITGTYQFSAIEGSNKQLQNTFVYKDSDFTKSSFKGSKSLETLSIQVAASSLSWYGKDLDKYEIDFSENDYNVKDFLSKMKFNNIESNKYYNLEKKENSVGVIVGEKKIVQDGKEYTLLAIVPRSAGYKQEWVGNFNIGGKDIHEGFKSARDEILRFTKNYIEKNNIKGNLKVWTVGYSRGAAISNMIGGFFAGGGIAYFGDEVSITPEDVYCYTIGTPSSIKDGTSKNDELSVSANRSGSDYVNDSKQDSFSYTKGGVVSVTDSIYNGVRSVISPNDSFSLLPPNQWGFTRYGKVVNSYDGLYSIEEMLKELKSISEYIYEEFTSDGKIKEFREKTFDLKSLSILEKNSNVSQIDFFKGRIDGLVSKIATNKIYSDEYQTALTSLLGIYGMTATIINITDTNSMEISEVLYPLIYSYLAYVSSELQNEGRASSDAEAVTIALEDLLTYYTGEDIDKESFTVDDFVKIFAKYISDNEDEVVADTVLSGIISIVPEEYRGYFSLLTSFTTKESFDPNSDEDIKDVLKAFIKACYYGPAEETPAYQSVQDPKKVREFLYMTMLMFSQNSGMTEINDLLVDKDSNINGHGKFEDFISLVLKSIKEEKNEENIIIKTYDTLGELADVKLLDLVDKALSSVIQKSEELYGKEYKNDLEKHINHLKENITKAREVLCGLFFYTEDRYDIVKSIDNAVTFIDNAILFAMPHFDEIYLALSRTSNRYDDDYVIIKGNDQTIDLAKANDLSLTFSFDYYLFNELGILYIDGNEISKDNYTISKGSTIITISNSYLNTLDEGEHTITANLSGKEVMGHFNISDGIDDSPINNPPTNDNIVFYILMLGISIFGLLGVELFYKKRAFR